MARYWIAVASREHVKRGVEGCFAQVCHGKPGPLKRMAAGDWIMYYSPTEKFGQKDPCRQFTAIGKVQAGDTYLFKMSEDFIPWRRNVTFMSAHDAAIEPLLDQLSFIKDKQRWGFPFRWGCFEISKADFCVIASAMGVDCNE